MAGLCLVDVLYNYRLSWPLRLFEFEDKWGHSDTCISIIFTDIVVFWAKRYQRVLEWCPSDRLRTIASNSTYRLSVKLSLVQTAKSGVLSMTPSQASVVGLLMVSGRRIQVTRSTTYGFKYVLPSNHNSRGLGNVAFWAI